MVYNKYLSAKVVSLSISKIIPYGWSPCIGDSNGRIRGCRFSLLFKGVDVS
jgi:hypothetical protein